jgi:hypothetical protein
MNDSEYEIEQIEKQLIGGTITAAIVSGESFGFEVKTRKGKKINVWVDCDPEGNGPGHLDIESE